MVDRFFRYEGLPDYWSLIRMTLAGIYLPRITLLRFDRLREALSDKWAETEPTVLRILRAEASAHLPADGSLVPFDPSAVLLIRGAGDQKSAADLAEEIAAKVAAHLPGWSRDNPFDAWEVVGVGDDGLSCRSRGDEPPSVAMVPSKPVILGDAEFVFHPVWDIRRSSVFAYRCQPSWAMDDRAAADEEDLEPQFRTPRRLAALDFETQHKGLAKLEEAMDHDAMASLMLPLHFETLESTETWPKYAAGLAEVGPVVRERVHLEVIHVPVHFNWSTLARAMAFRGNVSLRVGFDFGDFGSAMASGLFSVGVDLSHDRRDETAQIADMERFVLGAAKHAVRTHILGIRTTSLSVAAVCAGFDLVESQIIGASLEGWPMDDYLLKPIDLYRRLQSQAGRA